MSTGLASPLAADFRWAVSNATGRPPQSNWGTSVTPAVGSKGSWTEVLSSSDMTNSIQYLMLSFNGNAVSGQARTYLADVGVDPAGGTSYTTLISNLIAGEGPFLSSGGGQKYGFPIRIPAGSSVAVRYNASATTAAYVWVRGLGLPARPEAVRVGAYVETIGITDETNRLGTDITCGTTSNGSWTSVGSTSSDLWWWQMGNQDTTGAMNSGFIRFEVSAGSTGGDVTLVNDHIVYSSTSEFFSPFFQDVGREHPVPAGSTIYVRGQASNTANTGDQVAVYAVGG